ncbi:MAG: glycosyl transferase [Acidimicrobiales bacterium]|jgi:hypothetical protein|nr:glycosyl transferase [Acidimicrobiales bacterium]
MGGREGGGVNIFVWHVHGSWMTAFVQGVHEYLVPVLPSRGPDGRGRARTWDWPGNVVEIGPDEAARRDVDVVILQRPAELDQLGAEWLRRQPGEDIPAVYVEHDAPQGAVNAMRHPAAGRRGVTIAHVTHFNALFWDTGRTPTRVIEHGVPDPGARWTGDLPRAVTVINDPVRRGRITGTDTIPAFREVVPVDLFGMRSESIGGVDVPQSLLHEEMAHRRLYLHPVRWTSLGLSLLEAMHLAMPVVAFATTEVAEAVPEAAGVVSNRMDVLTAGIRRLVNDPDEAAAMGRAARQAASARFGLRRFLDDWDQLLAEVTT